MRDPVVGFGSDVSSVERADLDHMEQAGGSSLRGKQDAMSRNGQKGCSGQQNKKMPIPMASVGSVHTKELALRHPCPLVLQTPSRRAGQLQTSPNMKWSLRLAVHSSVVTSRSARVRGGGEDRDVGFLVLKNTFRGIYLLQNKSDQKSRLNPPSCHSESPPGKRHWAQPGAVACWWLTMSAQTTVNDQRRQAAGFRESGQGALHQIIGL